MTDDIVTEIRAILDQRRTLMNAPDTTDARLGAALRALRQSDDTDGWLSTGDVARTLGVSVVDVSAMENGHALIPSALAERWLALLLDPSQAVRKHVPTDAPPTTQAELLERCREALPMLEWRMFEHSAALRVWAMIPGARLTVAYHAPPPEYEPTAEWAPAGYEAEASTPGVGRGTGDRWLSAREAVADLAETLQATGLGDNMHYWHPVAAALTALVESANDPAMTAAQEARAWREAVTWGGSDPLHPRGRCTCGGEGRCPWHLVVAREEAMTDGIAGSIELLAESEGDGETAQLLRRIAQNIRDYGSATGPDGGGEE